MKVKLLTDTAVAPQMAHSTDAAFDLYADEEVFIGFGCQALVSTGVAMAIPGNCVGKIESRSSLASKHGINVGAGVIDSGYRGEVKVLLQASQFPFTVKKGERIAQLLIIPIERPEIEVVDILDTTDRGDSGFGSTGKNKLDLDSAELEI